MDSMAGLHGSTNAKAETCHNIKLKNAFKNALNIFENESLILNKNSESTETLKNV
jgi:hypothetical protein